MSTARRHCRSRVWLRVLVLLLALLAPGAPADLSAPPVAAAEIAEYDTPDAALRPAPCAHRTAAPPRPASAPAPAPAVAPQRPHSAPPGPPRTLRVLRTVVLRC